MGVAASKQRTVVTPPPSLVRNKRSLRSTLNRLVHNSSLIKSKVCVVLDPCFVSSSLAKLFLKIVTLFGFRSGESACGISAAFLWFNISVQYDLLIGKPYSLS
ncbi:unnamed protein product [Ceratitis capitata]|uniref:(Mediterranean fruit fly) hypothetical protein n=1 Tax=Ceratitis capitata TaxID=7213 RepID=A0A811V611_CERCA|nr:unnamed protein product [Ceratitis capitata]